MSDIYLPFTGTSNPLVKVCLKRTPDFWPELAGFEYKCDCPGWNSGLKKKNHGDMKSSGKYINLISVCCRDNITWIGYWLCGRNYHQSIKVETEMNYQRVHKPQYLFLLFSHWVMSNSFATPWTVACQASLSTGFSRQEYWSELPFPSPGDLPNPGIKPTYLTLAGRFFTWEAPVSPYLAFKFNHNRIVAVSSLCQIINRVQF